MGVQWRLHRELRMTEWYDCLACLAEVSWCDALGLKTGGCLEGFRQERQWRRDDGRRFHRGVCIKSHRTNAIVLKDRSGDGLLCDLCDNGERDGMRL